MRRLTTAPRCGQCSISPSALRRLSASRTGPRLTAKRAVKSPSTSRDPGSSRAARMSSRNRSTMKATVAPCAGGTAPRALAAAPGARLPSLSWRRRLTRAAPLILSYNRPTPIRRRREARGIGRREDAMLIGKPGAARTAIVGRVERPGDGARTRPRPRPHGPHRPSPNMSSCSRPAARRPRSSASFSI